MLGLDRGTWSVANCWIAGTLQGSIVGGHGVSLTGWPGATPDTEDAVHCDHKCHLRVTWLCHTSLMGTLQCPSMTTMSLSHWPLSFMGSHRECVP